MLCGGVELVMVGYGSLDMQGDIAACSAGIPPPVLPWDTRANRTPVCCCCRLVCVVEDHSGEGETKTTVGAVGELQLLQAAVFPATSQCKAWPCMHGCAAAHMCASRCVPPTSCLPVRIGPAPCVQTWEAVRWPRWCRARISMPAHAPAPMAPSEGCRAAAQNMPVVCCQPRPCFPYHCRTLAGGCLGVL